MKVGPVAEDVIYTGDLYERHTVGGVSTDTKYYYADGRRIAMRSGSTLYFLAADHLGGTSVVMNAASSLVNRVRYYPYGSIRTQEGGTPVTDRLFTGQRRLSENGIYNYGARTYNAMTGRFLQADAIVPGAGDPQALNRYSYVLNNPMRYTDPSGNVLMDDAGGGGMTFTQWYEWKLKSDPLFPSSLAVPLECITMAYLCDSSGPGLDWLFWSLPGIGDAEDLAGILSCSFQHLECGRWSSIPISAVGLVLPAGSSALKRADPDVVARLFRNAERGRAGEEVFGIAAKGKTGIRLSNDKLRIPDFLSREAKVIGEVKSGGYVPYSSQLRDLVRFAEENPGYTVVLATREDARLSIPLWNAIAEGKITLNQRSDFP